MIVYKFGGASVRSADGVRNLKDIISRAEDDVFVVVSAMGKTTNALEGVVQSFISGDSGGAIARLEAIERYHHEVCGELSGDGMPPLTEGFFMQLRTMIENQTGIETCYDYWYDRIVSFGELISTSIISAFLSREGLDPHWLDIRKLFVTSARHRDANIDIAASTDLLKTAVSAPEGRGSSLRIFITQGFIGATPHGQATTLGREGSDYSAAVAAYILDARSVTIWKDVDGILNADPKFFCGTRLIPHLSYLDAIELAYSGAQVIHPKTIKPLENKHIPLYVKPFGNICASGSAISADTTGSITAPVLILKKDQVLVSVRPHDFSFVVEEKLPEIFSLMRKFNIKMNMVQSSAVNLSICVDRTRQLERFGGELRKQGFRVVYNEGLELLTIRSYDEPTFARHSKVAGVVLVQKTRRTARILRPQSPDGNCLEV